MAILQEKFGLTREDLRKLRSMRPGLSLDLQIMSVSGIKRVRTEFIGMDGNKSLIIKFPDESRWGSLRDAIYVDSSLVVRYIYEDDVGEVVAFKVKTNIILSKPSNYIFTSFPLSLQCHPLRCEQRSQVHVHVEVLDGMSNAVLYDGLIIDISMGGCRVSIDRALVSQKLAHNEKITLSIKNPNGQVSKLKAMVMNQKSDETRYYFGVKFEGSEELVEELLQQLMIS
ncbi:PilZ domain-containing protein [Aliiglaciecola litoralis]|uniref:Flagellar brake protein n=1 Tax=Aliiglaciecola litoralis TaxID=582857 RepID=A0ABN1LKQ2_9ALTE